jgi:Mg/Co/Ni transporter MgtE
VPPRLDGGDGARLRFDTAAQHATRDVPVVHPQQLLRDVRAVSVFATCSTATAAAVALPWLISALRFDPAFGSGPLATVLQDLLSIWMYLSITTLLLS